MQRITPKRLTKEAPLMVRVSDLSLIWGCSRYTVYRMIDSGDLPIPTRINRKVQYWMKKDINKYLKEMRQRD